MKDATGRPRARPLPRVGDVLLLDRPADDPPMPSGWILTRQVAGRRHWAKIVVDPGEPVPDGAVIVEPQPRRR